MAGHFVCAFRVWRKGLTVCNTVLSNAQDSGAVLALLDIAPGVSRVHASRRVFDLLQRHDIPIPVIHQRRFAPGARSVSVPLLPFLIVGALPDQPCNGNLLILLPVMLHSGWCQHRFCCSVVHNGMAVCSKLVSG